MFVVSHWSFDDWGLVATLDAPQAFVVVGCLQLGVDFSEKRLVQQKVLGVHHAKCTLFILVLLLHLLEQVVLVVQVYFLDALLQSLLFLLVVLFVSLPHSGLHVDV